MIKTGTTVTIDGLGMVRFVVRPTSNKISARWKDNMLACNVPPFISRKYVEQWLMDNREKLAGTHPGRWFNPGQKFDFGDWSVDIVAGDNGRNRGLIVGYPSGMESRIVVPDGFDFDSPDSTFRISQVMCKIARCVAPSILLPFAKAIADRINRRPIAWNISHGHRVLGTCTPRGEINISYMLSFLPRELREYIVCHELAHLSEMNHSARFHEVCNAYCGGREKELEKALRNFRFPVVR